MVLNYDYNFLGVKRITALRNLPLLPQWTVTKRLTQDDLQQLTLTNELVMALFHVNTVNLPLNQQGPLNVLDFDNGVQTQIILRRVEEESHAFCEGWVDNFVNRRDLIPGQLVGFYDDLLSTRLFFSVLNNPPQAPQWTFTKRLTQEDLQQLLITNVQVQELFGYHITPDKNREVNQSYLLDVQDFDRGTEHNITMRRVAEDAQAFCESEWVQNFVDRRGLVEGHLVGFYWDHESHRLVFSLLGKFVAADNSEEDE